MKKLIYILPVVFLMILSTACNSSRKTVSPGAGQIAGMSLQERFRTLVDGYGDWNCVEVPVKVSLKSPGGVSLSGKAYMRHGKDIMLSLRFLGMEVATLYVSGDSLYAADKMHKYYVAESIRDALSGYDISVGDIQDLIMGRAFMLGSGTLVYNSRKKLAIEDTGDVWLILPHATAEGVEYGYSVDNETNRLLRLMVGVPGLEPVTVDYSGTVETPAGTVADNMSVTARVKKTDIAAGMAWSFEKAVWNVPDNLRSWKMPVGYKRLKSGDLVKMLSSF